MSRDIETQVADDGAAALTLARPERRNALSIKMRDEITQQLEDWAANPAVRVVVLTGAGPTFCAGFDLNEFGQADLAQRIKDSSRRYHLAVWHFPKPLVAAVNGPAMGGGMDLSVLCDCRIASSAAAFGHPEIKFGAAPLFTPLQWIVGLGAARELCLTGRRIDAAEALRIGLVTRVTEPDDLLDEAQAMARSIIEAPQGRARNRKALSHQ
jgi:enoyl-CoA hydratase/carnithine racemase